MKNLLWIDCTAAAVVGLAVVTLCGWLSRLYAVPRSLLLFTGIANLVYASYSFWLASRNRRPLGAIYALVSANFAWALVCVYLVFTVADSATGLGIAHLLGEAVFVTGLASLEWHWRSRLLLRDRRFVDHPAA